MTLRRIVLAATMAAVTATSVAVTPGPGPKRELRSTWFTTHVNIDWPRTKGTSASTVASQKADLLNYLDGFERINLNGICFQVRAQTDAVYKSSYEPWSAVMTGTRGQDPGWDPLAFAVEECHKRGLECYAWINPYRWSTGTDYKTPQDKEFKNNGWILSYGNYYVLNPALPQVREHILKVCKEIVDNYALDGVLFDDYFYPNNIPENNTAGDWDLYKASGTDMSIGDWRRENINMFVREFQTMIESSHPDMRFGISPAGVAGKSASKFGVDPVPVSAGDWQYNSIYSDPLAWLYDGSIDFISPQIYWTTTHSTAPYEPLCKWWSTVADKFGRHFYSSQSVSFLSNANTKSNWQEVAVQVQLNRDYAVPTVQDAPGTIYFSSKYFNGPAVSGLGDHLLAAVYGHKSLVPVIDWKNVPLPPAPMSMHWDGTRLQWDTVDIPGRIIRYTVYAVPRALSMEQARSADGDGLDIRYMQKVVYGNTWTPAEGGDCWYAVCTYDGLGRESDPVVANYPGGVSAAVDLLSPAAGAMVGWNPVLTWSAGAAGSQYRVRVATDAAMGNVLAASEYVTMTSMEMDLGDAPAQTPLYWQVACREPDKLETWSDIRTMVTPAYDPAPQVKLLTPADGESVKDGNIDFAWTLPGQGCEFRLQVAPDDRFDKLTYTVVTANNSATVNPSLIGKGNYRWRVVTTGRHMLPTPSASRALTVEALSVGAFEPGYTIERDPAAYDPTPTTGLENLWVRATEAPYGNINFADDGTYQRGMVAVGNFVYLTRRSENATGASLMLDKYDGFTGEKIATVTLGDEARLPYYPLNSIIKDDADNIIVSNLSLNTTTTPVVLHSVNIDDGSLNEVARIQLANLESARVDHVGVAGDVAKGDFAVFMALSSQPVLVRVTYKDGKQTTVDRLTVARFNPDYRTHFGIAANPVALDRDNVMVNGGGGAMAVYEFTTGSMTGTLPGHSASSTNGAARFTLGQGVYTVVPASDWNGAYGHTFDLYRGTDGDLSQAAHLFNFPAQGLGKVYNSTNSTPISAVTDADGSARVYTYAVGNGLAAYRVTDAGSAVQTIATGNAATAPVYYNLQGMRVDYPVKGRVYIINTDGKARKVRY